MTDGSGNSADVTESEARSASPYATGGGGVTLERRVAVTYLARLLTGATADELEGRRVERVSFQQAPAHDVDDLVVVGRRDDGTDLIELEIAVRRAPAFTTSDKDTEKLIGDLMAALRRPPDAGVMRELAICVAGPQKAAQQVGKLVETTISYTVCLTDPTTPMGRRCGRATSLVSAVKCARWFRARG